MSLFTAIRRWEDGVVPMSTCTLQMFGIDFGCVEYVFFATVKGTTVDPMFAVNHVLLSFILDENFSIVVHHNRVIFMNYNTGLNHQLIHNKSWRFGCNVIWLWPTTELVRMVSDLDDSEMMIY